MLRGLLRFNSQVAASLAPGNKISSRSARFHIHASAAHHAVTSGTKMSTLLLNALSTGFRGRSDISSIAASGSKQLAVQNNFKCCITPSGALSKLAQSSRTVHVAAWDVLAAAGVTRWGQRTCRVNRSNFIWAAKSATSRAFPRLVPSTPIVAQTSRRSPWQRSSPQALGSGAGGTAVRAQRRAYNGSPYSQVRLQQPVLVGAIDPRNMVKYLIGLNVAVWGAWQIWPYFMNRHFVTSPQALREGRWHTLLTSAFSQSEVWHLAGNMITLYFFGQDVMLLFGPTLFLQLYCGAGAVAAAAQVGWSWYKAVYGPGGQKVPQSFREMQLRHAPGALGASGAVSAVMAAGVLMAPLRLVYVLVPIPVPMPAIILGLGYMYVGVSGAMKDDSSVGHVAHLTGAAAGAAVFVARRRGLIRGRW